ncbi:MAG: hypothetical protein M9928_09870 [Anaerolineae bacterium]|nr:hypothetical protein [Anaerolineae bacterium]MCO5187897.1 hypothetical protein [Anaerolineae bacterium]MCO5205329.1 hypothetical protein [Anaerolineae bacterium]
MSSLRAVRSALSRRLDHLVQSGFSYRVPLTFEETYRQAPPFEQVLDTTRVALPLMPDMGFLQEREYRFWLHTEIGRIHTRLRVLPAKRPDAPLLVYHHGFFEVPYHARAQAFFRPRDPFDAHIVLLQAPFHRRPLQPLDLGFQNLHHLYQMIAGSVRMMQMVVDHYLALGTPYAVAAGMSLGGIITLTYEGFFGRSRAVIPILSSPNFAQLLWDISRQTKRNVTIPLEEIEARLDFSRCYDHIDPTRIYPLMGINDRFFRHGSHAPIFNQCDVTTIRSSHVSGMWHRRETREHIIRVLQLCRDMGNASDTDSAESDQKSAATEPIAALAAD